MRGLSFLICSVAVLTIYNIGHFGRVHISPSNKGRALVTIEKVDNKAYSTKPVREINYLETENDIDNWFVRTDSKENISISRSALNVTQGKYSMQVKWQKAGWVELTLVHFPEEWQMYRALDLDIFNADNNNGEFILEIGDKFDASSFYPEANKYTHEESLKPGLNKIHINISDISKIINIYADRKVMHLRFLGKDKTFYIDNIRLK